MFYWGPCCTKQNKTKLAWLIQIRFRYVGYKFLGQQSNLMHSFKYLLLNGSLICVRGFILGHRHGKSLTTYIIDILTKEEEAGNRP